MNRSRVAVPVSGALATLVVFSSLLLGGRPAAATAGASVAASASASVAGTVGASVAVMAGASADSLPVGQFRESVLVTGQGEVFGEPDTLVSSFAVETSASTVGEALEHAGAAAGRMRDTLVRAGIAGADLQTSNVDIGSRRKDNGEVTGYTVTQGLTAKIRNLPRAGALLSAAIAAGGDAARLNGVSFAVENDAALLTEARRKAFADARAKAGLYAGEAGRRLGRVVKVSEVASRDEEPGGQDRMIAADAPMPIEPGRQRLTVTVTVEWAFQ